MINLLQLRVSNCNFVAFSSENKQGPMVLIFRSQKALKYYSCSKYNSNFAFAYALIVYTVILVRYVINVANFDNKSLDGLDVTRKIDLTWPQLLANQKPKLQLT